MENVKGMIQGAQKTVYLECVKELRKCGYIAYGQVLNAMFYNVPQSRERVFIIGVRKDIFEQYKSGIDVDSIPDYALI
jgi:DNA (cytosine-5)-methyltransferase 1